MSIPVGQICMQGDCIKPAIKQYHDTYYCDDCHPDSSKYTEVTTHWTEARVYKIPKEIAKLSSDEIYDWIHKNFSEDLIIKSETFNFEIIDKN